jgi:hypothetical protein
LQKKWNKICMKQLAGGKQMENDLKFEMCAFKIHSNTSVSFNP